MMDMQMNMENQPSQASQPPLLTINPIASKMFILNTIQTEMEMDMDNIHLSTTTTPGSNRHTAP